MNQQKGFIPLMVLAVIVLVGAAAIIFLKNPNLITKSKPSVVPTMAPAQDLTANWKTYTNSKLKISFLYPSGWQTKEYDNNEGVTVGDKYRYSFSISLSIDSPAGYETDPQGIIKNYLDHYIGSTSQFLTGGKIIDTINIEVGGYKATKYIVQESDPKSAGGNYNTRTWIFIPNNNRVTFISQEPYEEVDVQIMDQTLSTFKFTNEQGAASPVQIQKANLVPTSGWKNVSAETFQVSYPSEYTPFSSGDGINFRHTKNPETVAVMDIIRVGDKERYRPEAVYSGGSRRDWYLRANYDNNHPAPKNLVFTEKMLGSVSSLEVFQGSDLLAILFANGTKLYLLSGQFGVGLNLLETMGSTVVFK